MVEQWTFAKNIIQTKLICNSSYCCYLVLALFLFSHEMCDMLQLTVINNLIMWLNKCESVHIWQLIMFNCFLISIDIKYMYMTTFCETVTFTTFELKPGFKHNWWLANINLLFCSSSLPTSLSLGWYRHSAILAQLSIMIQLSWWLSGGYWSWIWPQGTHGWWRYEER